MKSKITMIALLAASVFGGDAYAAKVTTYECKVVHTIEVIDSKPVFVSTKDLRNNPIHNGYKVNLIESDDDTAKFIVSSAAIGTVIDRSKKMGKPNDDLALYAYMDEAKEESYGVMRKTNKKLKGERAFISINDGKGRAYDKCKEVK